MTLASVPPPAGHVPPSFTGGFFGQPAGVPAGVPGGVPAGAAGRAAGGARGGTPADGDGGAERLVSGEAVEVDVRLARLGSRTLALLIDAFTEIVLLMILAIVLTTVLHAVYPGATIAAESAMGIFGVVLAFVGYPTLLETLAGGRTLGKLALGLRVVREDGGPVRFRHALTRALVGLAVEWPGMLLAPLSWLLAMTTMLANKRGQRLGDLTAGTIVIHERTAAEWGWIPAMPPQLVRWAATLDLTGLDDDLALSVRHYLARNRQLREPARTRLGYALAGEVAARVVPPPPPGTPGWAYLAGVLAERHRRAAARLVQLRSATATVWPELVQAVVNPARVSQPSPFVSLAPPGVPVTVRPAAPNR